MTNTVRVKHKRARARDCLTSIRVVPVRSTVLQNLRFDVRPFQLIKYFSSSLSLDRVLKRECCGQYVLDGDAIQTSISRLHAHD